MKRALFLLLVLAAPSSAQLRAPHCLDQSPARFTGNPFFPELCPNGLLAPTPGSGEVLLSTATMPVFKKNPKADFTPVLGSWEGWAFYGMGRYQLAASAERAGRRVILKLAITDHATLRTNKFRAELKKSFWHHGRYHTVVEWLDAPGAQLRGRAWLGAAPPPVEQGLDWSFVLSYDELAAINEARFMVDGPDKIRFSYIYRPTNAPAIQIGGTLTRSQRAPY